MTQKRALTSTTSLLFQTTMEEWEAVTVSHLISPNVSPDINFFLKICFVSTIFQVMQVIQNPHWMQYNARP